MKNWRKIDKRTRFIVSTAILSFLMLLSTFFFFDKVLIFIPVFVFAAYFLTYFSLLEEIEKIEWLMLFLIPIVFTVSFYLFYFLFPVRWLSRLPFILFYGISIYANLRTANIFNVGVEKSLQLYRAAFSVNYFYHTVIIFFLANFLFSLKLNPFLNGIISALMVFVISVQFFWTIRLKLNIEKETYQYALIMGLIIGEAITALSFFPFETSLMALLITASYYGVAGLIYSFLDQRLFKETTREYIFVIVFVFAIAILSLIKL